jgi:hypothetical protein
VTPGEKRDLRIWNNRGSMEGKVTGNISNLRHHSQTHLAYFTDFGEQMNLENMRITSTKKNVTECSAAGMVATVRKK